MMSSLSFSLSSGDWLPVGSAWPGHLPQLSRAQYQVVFNARYNAIKNFMYQRRILYTLHITVDFFIFLYKWLFGGGGPTPPTPLFYCSCVGNGMGMGWWGGGVGIAVQSKFISYRWGGVVSGTKWIYFAPLPLTISTFWAQMALSSLVAISGPPKNLDFQCPPLPMALEMDLPSS